MGLHFFDVPQRDFALCGDEGGRHHERATHELRGRDQLAKHDASSAECEDGNQAEIEGETGRRHPLECFEV